MYFATLYQVGNQDANGTLNRRIEHVLMVEKNKVAGVHLKHSRRQRELELGTHPMDTIAIPGEGLACPKGMSVSWLLLL